MRRSTATKVIVGGILALGVGTAGGAAVAAGGTGLLSPWGITADLNTETEPMPTPTYQANASGETFGSLADAPSPDDAPDLIQVVSTGGKTGYVRRSELEAVDGTAAMKTFTSPADALAWQESQADRAQETVQVYLEDGKTVIGEFLVAFDEPRER